MASGVISTFRKSPLRGSSPHTLPADAPARAARPEGSVSPTPLSSSFHVPVRRPSDLATVKISTPFASCCPTFRSVALSIFGRPSFTGQPIRRDLQLVRQIIVEKGFWTGIRETIQKTDELYGMKYRGSAIPGESKSY